MPEELRVQAQVVPQPLAGWGSDPALINHNHGVIIMDVQVAAIAFVGGTCLGLVGAVQLDKAADADMASRIPAQVEQCARKLSGEK
jgi:hypothetical protein